MICQGQAIPRARLSAVILLFDILIESIMNIKRIRRPNNSAENDLIILKNVKDLQHGYKEYVKVVNMRKKYM